MNQSQVLAGKRVLFVLCGFDLGGAERQALYLASHLKKLGCHVRLWGHHHHTAGPERVIAQCEALGIPWAIQRFRWPCRKLELVRDSWKMLRALYRERPDVILPYTTWPNVGCGITWRWSKAKVCIWGQRDVRLRGDAVERYAYRRASAVICNAAHEVQYLKVKLGKAKAPMFVVNNGLELPSPRQTRDEWRARLGIEEGSTVATMVANFRPGKDHQTLLKAWRKLLNFLHGRDCQPHLLLAGAHQETYSSVYQMAKDFSLLDSVSFIGQVQDVSGLLAASDIGILATADEGLPNAILEYMASGLPVVATNIPGNREALGNDERQVVCKIGDVDGLAAGIQAFLIDETSRRVVGDRNRNRALSEFSISTMCERTTAILCNLLGRY